MQAGAGRPPAPDRRLRDGLRALEQRAAPDVPESFGADRRSLLLTSIIVLASTAVGLIGMFVVVVVVVVDVAVDARCRGVPRRVGPVYLFRHETLRQAHETKHES